MGGQSTAAADARAASRLPDGLEAYRRTPVFTEANVPPALRADHDTKPGVWGLIHVLEGRLRYRVTDARRPAQEFLLSPEGLPGVVEPTIRHHVAPDGPVRFQVEFWRAPGQAAA